MFLQYLKVNTFPHHLVIINALANQTALGTFCYSDAYIIEYQIGMFFRTVYTHTFQYHYASSDVILSYTHLDFCTGSVDTHEVHRHVLWRGELGLLCF